MSIEDAIAELKTGLDEVSLPTNTDLNRLTDETLTGNISPLITNLAAAIVSEFKDSDNPLSELFINIFQSLMDEPPVVATKGKASTKLTSSEITLENSRQTWEWLATTTPFQQILNIFKSFTYFSTIMFGEVNSTREKANQQANRENRPNLLDPQTLVQQYYREPENQEAIKQILTMHGLSNTDIDTLIKLNQFYASPSDLITFAVREVFSPTVVEKFGLNKEFPADFQTEAALVGMSADTAKAFWAAHWQLPSRNEMREMLHRGEIDDAQVDVILKAQDVMPNFRAPIKAISYNTMTRVDIRRVYHAEVEDEAWVKKQHKNMGYNEADATTLTKLIVQEYNAQNRSFNTSQLLSLYSDKVMDITTLRAELKEMGHPDDNLEYLIERRDIADAKKLEKRLTSKIKSNFINGGLANHATVTQLTNIGMDSERIQNIMFDWQIDKDATQKKFTTAQIKKLLDNNLMDVPTAEKELIQQNWSRDKALLLISLWGMSDDEEA